MSRHVHDARVVWAIAISLNQDLKKQLPNQEDDVKKKYINTIN